MNDYVGVVYLINNKINSKKYIGITTRKNGFDGRYPMRGNGIERVYRYHDMCRKSKSYSYYNVHLYNSIKKYGFDNFEVNKQIDCAYSQSELKEKERYWIEFYNSNDYRYGYNHTNGGEGLEGCYQEVFSKLKGRITKAKNFNTTLNYWLDIRNSWENPFVFIWDHEDGLDNYGKKVLFHKLNDGKTKNCQICDIEFIKSEPGNLCKKCLDPSFLKEYTDKKEIIEQLIIN